LKTVGIIGCGAIGTVIAEAVDKGIVSCDGLVLYDCDVKKAEKLQKRLRVPSKIVKNVNEMVALKPAVIVEAASQQAVKEYAGKVLSANIDLIVMSVGALLDLKIRSGKIHVPSGAIGGLDAVGNAALAGIDSVVLTTRKNPKILDSGSRVEKIVFEGSAEEAVKRFPREINVAAALALAASPEKVKVRVISDPKVKRNVHEIRVQWKYGDMFFRFENEPHPDNPGTSALAAWSGINLLKDVLQKSS